MVPEFLVTLSPLQVLGRIQIDSFGCGYGSQYVCQCRNNRQMHWADARDIAIVGVGVGAESGFTKPGFGTEPNLRES